MVDPISAAGLASGILTFVDSVYKVTARSIKAYRSQDKNTARNKAIEDYKVAYRQYHDLVASNVFENASHRGTACMQQVLELSKDVSERISFLIKELEKKNTPRHIQWLWKSEKLIDINKELEALQDRLFKLQGMVAAHQININKYV